jgi:hypothetical protein
VSLTGADQQALVAFLRTLTDERLLSAKLARAPATLAHHENSNQPNSTR